MFLTIGLVIGFIAGWWINEKVEDLGAKINPIKWFKKQNGNDGGFSMFRHIRRWIETYKKSLFDSYDPPKPVVYKIGDKRYVRTKRIRTPQSRK